MKYADMKSIIKESLREAFFSKKVLLTESMNLYIKGANYEKLEELHEIGWKIMRPVWQFLESLPKDQLEYFMKNRMPETLTPDGDDYFKPYGILNLYTAGLTRQALTGTLKLIFKGLRDLGIPFGKVKTEQSGMFKSGVIRIPILKNPYHGTYQGPPELNLSNTNAYQIFHNVLQYEGEHEFHMKAKELMERIETLANDPGWIDKNKINPTDTGIPDAEQDGNPDLENPHMDIVNQLGNALGGPRMIGGGISGERIRDVLHEVYLIAQWADDHGFEDLYIA